MNEHIRNLYKTHNLYAQEGVLSARQKVASILGEEALPAFDEFLGTIPEEEIFDTEDNAQKVASDLGDEGIGQVQDVDALGRQIFHAMAAEQAAHQKVAEAVEDELCRSFASYLQSAQ